MKKKILAILLIGAMLILMSGCSKQTSGTFRVGMECNYAPFNWTQSEESEGSVALEGGGYEDGYDAVSYTHLDVYKRQAL